MPAGLNGVDTMQFERNGFLRLPAFLTTEECRSIVREYTVAFAEAFGHVPAERLPVWLPGLADTTPTSADLVVDDGTLWEVAQRLIGPCLPCPPEVGLLGHRLTPWHKDDPLGLTGVKFLAYVDGASTGLWLLPSSHRVKDDDTACLALLEDRFIIDPIPVDIRLGDVIAIDLHVWHCNTNRRRRILWAPEYIAVPAVTEVAKYRSKWESIAKAGTSESGLFEWPVWREWLSAEHISGRRRHAIAVLAQAGAFVDDYALR
jgi:hypothetical protein